MKRETKILLPMCIAILAFGAFFSGTRAAEAKTEKNLVIKSIDDDQKEIKALKNGDTYTIDASSAKIRKGSSGNKSMTFSQLSSGDVINVEGTFTDKDVTATKVRDLSYNDKKSVTFYGKIDSINTAAKTIKIKTLHRGKLTVAVLNSTKIKDKDNKTILLGDLEKGDRVLVRGTWSRTKKTITKTKSIEALHDSDYDDLGD